MVEPASPPAGVDIRRDDALNRRRPCRHRPPARQDEGALHPDDSARTAHGPSPRLAAPPHLTMLPFGEDGLLMNFISEDRSRSSSDGKTFTRLRFSRPVCATIAISVPCVSRRAATRDGRSRAGVALLHSLKCASMVTPPDVVCQTVVCPRKRTEASLLSRRPT